MELTPEERARIYEEEKARAEARAKAEEEVKRRRKKPWVSAVLNFFLPGIGFIYIGKPLFIFGGILFFLADLIYSFTSDWMSGTAFITALFGGVAMAILGYASVELLNEGKGD